MQTPMVSAALLPGNVTFPLALSAQNHASASCQDLPFVVFLLHFPISDAELFLFVPCCEGRSYFQRNAFQTFFFLTFSSSVFTPETISWPLLIIPVLAFQVAVT